MTTTSHTPRDSRPIEVGPVSRVGLRLKQLVLAFGGAYLLMVCVTNLVNVVAEVSGHGWTFLNSGNDGYIASIVKIYSVPSWFDTLAVLGAATIEGIGAALFARALLRFTGGGRGLREAYQALAWNIGVWFAFIAGTEIFIAYPSESPFRELLGLGLLMTLVVTLVPDAVPDESNTRATPAGDD
jgi:hypothetical protein